MAQYVPSQEFSLFGYDYGTSAPKLEPLDDPKKKQPKKSKPAKKTSPKQHGNVKTSSKAKQRANVQSGLKTATVCLSIAAVFFIVAFAMVLNVRLDETAREISNVQSEIDIAKSENTRLSSSLESIVSISKVEDYAVNVLGMVKLENYKITYFEGENNNHVVVSGGKSYGGNDLGSKIKSLFDGIF